MTLTNHADARRFDTRPVVGALAAWALAALEVLDEAGVDWVLERGPWLAGRLAEELASTGRAVRPRGASTLVSWSEPDPESVVARLAAAGVVVRALPAHGLVRASVGAWNDEGDLDRLLGGLT
jgi:L-cysteine/cystine lyase